MIWNDDFHQKIHTFWVFEGEGRERKWCLEYGLMSFVPKQ